MKKILYLIIIVVLAILMSIPFSAYAEGDSAAFTMADEIGNIELYSNTSEGEPTVQAEEAYIIVCYSNRNEQVVYETFSFDDLGITEGDCWSDITVYFNNDIFEERSYWFRSNGDDTVTFLCGGYELPNGEWSYKREFLLLDYDYTVLYGKCEVSNGSTYYLSYATPSDECEHDYLGDSDGVYEEYGCIYCCDRCDYVLDSSSEEERYVCSVCSGVKSLIAYPSFTITDLDGTVIEIPYSEDNKTWAQIAEEGVIDGLSAPSGVSCVTYNGKPITLNGAPVASSAMPSADQNFVAVDRTPVLIILNDGMKFYIFEGDTWADVEVYQSIISCEYGYVKCAGSVLWNLDEERTVLPDDVIDDSLTYERFAGLYSFYLHESDIFDDYTDGIEFYAPSGFTWQEFVADCKATGRYDCFDITAGQVIYQSVCAPYKLMVMGSASPVSVDSSVISSVVSGISNSVYILSADNVNASHKGDAMLIDSVAATCLVNGYTTYQCSTCGLIYTYVSYASTDYCDWELVSEQAASCIEEGYKEYECALCGETKRVILDMVAHAYAESDNQEPTCTESGAITYTCEICEETKTEAVPALGHKYDNLADLTCNRCGYNKLTGKYSSDFSNSDSGNWLDGIGDFFDNAFDQVNSGFNRVIALVMGLLVVYVILKFIPPIIDVFKSIFRKR